MVDTRASIDTRHEGILGWSQTRSVRKKNENKKSVVQST